MNIKIKFFVVVALQIVLLFVMFSFYQNILNTGTEVWLKTKPVDPRDLFRGDYIQLGYKINQLNSVSVYDGSIEDSSGFKEGDSVYVVLTKSYSDKFSSAENYNVSKTRCGGSYSDQLNRTLCIKGKVTNVSNGSGEYNKNLTLNYGINQFFVPEGSARSFNNTNNAEVKIVIDKNSNALIREVYIEGKKI